MLNNRQLRSVINTGISLSVEQDKNKLYAMLIRTAMEISHCDAGTLYLYKNQSLEFKIMKTLSLGISRGEDGAVIDLPPVVMSEGNVCAYAAIHQSLINIPDVYHSDMFDFSGPKKYDALTGYHTGSMLVIPLADADKTLVGVLQLMNAQDEEGRIIPFSEDHEFVIRSLGSMAAISILNALYIDQINDQLHSFVEAFATAVDERTPYNGQHTRKVTVYTSLVTNQINQEYEAGLTDHHFSKKDKEQLVMAASLHDIGKMIVPLSVMNKATRLDGRLDAIANRFALLEAYYEIDAFRGLIPEEQKCEKIRELKDDLAFITSIDAVGFLDDEKLRRVGQIATQIYVAEDGRQIPYLTAEEEACLSIRKGTLTGEERSVIESHVVMTKQILDKVRFSKDYEQVTRLASSHHELLNGSGYPNHLSGEELDLGIRILAVTDIFDALTSTDRPYKKPIPRPKAFDILRSMVDEGKLDGQVVTWLEHALTNVTEEQITAMSLTTLNEKGT